MSAQFATPPRQQQQLTAALAPHPQPLGRLANGELDANNTARLADIKTCPPPHPNAYRIMNEAFKLAHAILLHPKAVRIASEVMSNSMSPEKL